MSDSGCCPVTMQAPQHTGGGCGTHRPQICTAPQNPLSTAPQTPQKRLPLFTAPQTPLCTAPQTPLVHSPTDPSAQAPSARPHGPVHTDMHTEHSLRNVSAFGTTSRASQGPGEKEKGKQVAGVGRGAALWQCQPLFLSGVWP